MAIEKGFGILRLALPENDPDLCMCDAIPAILLACALTRSAPGEAIRLLATTHSSLGRHAEALVMLKKLLELYQRTLPESHPDIGAA